MFNIKSANHEFLTTNRLSPEKQFHTMRMRTSESGASAITANNKGKKLCDYVFIDGKLFDKVDDFSYQEHFLEQI